MQSRLNQVTLVLSDELFTEYVAMQQEYLDYIISRKPIPLGAHPLHADEFERLRPTRCEPLTRNPAKGQIIQWDWLEWDERNPFAHIIATILATKYPGQYRYYRIGSNQGDAEVRGSFPVEGYYPEIGIRHRWKLETIPEVPTPRHENCVAHFDYGLRADATMDFPMEIVLAVSPAMEEKLQRIIAEIRTEEDDDELSQYLDKVFNQVRNQIRHEEYVVRYWYSIYILDNEIDVAGAVFDRATKELDPDQFRLVICFHGTSPDEPNEPSVYGTFEKPVLYRTVAIAYSTPNPNKQHN